MGHVSFREGKSIFLHPRKTNMEPENASERKREKIFFYKPPDFGVPCQFSGVYLSTKFQGKFRMIQN